MSDQDGRQAAAPPYPSQEDTEGRKAYWQVRGQPWRTQPTISTERQEELKKYLEERKPDVETGTYPFKDVTLNRADVEWLLATHESGGVCGPVDLSDERQREREGLDLRGAHLEGEDLSGLPLARLRGGLTLDEWLRHTRVRPEIVAVHLQEAILGGADLQEAILGGADLQEARLWSANLQKADLWSANLQRANLFQANLQGANLKSANLQSTILQEANLQKANLESTTSQRAILWSADLQEARLWSANLQKAMLRSANLQKADLEDADLQEADVWSANLQEANLTRAQLKGANLEGVTIGNEKQVGPQLADSQWSEVNLTVIEWSWAKILGDEFAARQKSYSNGKNKNEQTRLSEYKAAVRANRQLAVILRNQGLNEVADRFAYRAHVLQWHVVHRQLLQQVEQVQPPTQQQEARKQNSDEREIFNLSKLFAELLDWPSLLLLEVAHPLQDTPLLKVFLLAFQLLTLLYLVVPLLCLFLLLLISLPFICIWILELLLSLAARVFPRLLTKLGYKQQRLQPLPLPLTTEQFKASISSANRQAHCLFTLFFKTLKVHIVSLGSLLLDLLTGYGYKPEWIFFWYLVIVLGFALAYHTQAPQVLLTQGQYGPLSWKGAFILSITAFHGRGFFLGGQFGYESTVTLLAAIEAIVGLFIELCFIATFTQRFLGK